MVTASDLREGMALRINDQVYRILEVESRAAAAKMGGTIRTRLVNVHSGRVWDQHFRPQEKVEEVELQRAQLEFLFSDALTATFLRLDTYEQIEVPVTEVGMAVKLLQPGTELAGDFFDGQLIRVFLPETVEARVATTAPPARSQQDSGRKEATLEDGQLIQVPLFVAPGDLVTVELKTGRYLERVRTQHKKGT